MFLSCALAGAPLTLEPMEVARLGVEVVPVQRATLPATRTYRGVLVAPGSPGMPATPPVSPAVDAEAAARVASAWSTAVEAVKIVQTDLDLARAELDRATRLASGDAGSARRLEEARAAVAREEARLAGARERERFARRLLETDRPEPWVRVPVYLGDRPRLDLTAPAALHALGDATPWRVEPVVGAGGADPVAGTLDVLYDAAGYPGRPGEVVAVAIPTREAEEGPAVPCAAVLYDPAGVAWVYVQRDEGTYERVRVGVQAVRDGSCRLADGPSEGTPVVTDGAAELYGHELGMGR